MQANRDTVFWQLNFHSLEVVDRVSETQLQVSENSDSHIIHVKRIDTGLNSCLRYVVGFKAFHVPSAVLDNMYIPPNWKCYISAVWSLDQRLQWWSNVWSTYLLAGTWWTWRPRSTKDLTTQLLHSKSSSYLLWWAISKNTRCNSEFLDKIVHKVI